MTIIPTFTNYDKLYDVRPSDLLEFLKQTSYKNDIEQVERGNLALQYYYNWFDFDGEQCYNDDDADGMKKGDCPINFITELEEFLSDVNFPSEVWIGIGRFDWRKKGVPGVEKRIVRIHDIYPSGDSYLFDVEVVEPGEYDDMDKFQLEYYGHKK